MGPPASMAPDSSTAPDSATASSVEPSLLPPSPPMPPSSPSTKKDTTQTTVHSIHVQPRLNDDDDQYNAEQSHCAQRLPLFKTVRIQEAMSFAKTPVRHHELNPIHYNRLFRFLIS